MAGSTDDPSALERWIRAGGHWSVLTEGIEDGGVVLTVGLFTCDGGEEMGRLRLRATDLPEE